MKCSKCTDPKTKDDFYYRKSGKLVSTICRSCQSEIKRKKRRKTNEYYQELRDNEKEVIMETNKLATMKW